MDCHIASPARSGGTVPSNNGTNQNNITYPGFGGAKVGTITERSATIATLAPKNKRRAIVAGWRANCPNRRRSISCCCHFSMVLSIGFSTRAKPRPYGSGRMVLASEASSAMSSPYLGGVRLIMALIQKLAGVAGFEPAIFGLGGRCIIQLCYTPNVAKTPPLMEVTVVELLQRHAAFVPLECALVRNGEGGHRNRLMHSRRLLVDLQED